MTASSPYLDARRAWDERYGDLITRARNWRLVACFSALGTIMSASCLMIVLLRPKASTYVVAVDSLGRTVASGEADHIATADEKIKRATLQGWLQTWRQITSDKNAQAKLMENVVYSHAAQNSPAIAQIAEYYDVHGPRNVFLRLEKETIEVQVESIMPTTPDGKVYELRWEEITRNISTGDTAREHWVASVTVAITPTTDEKQLRLNPLGIYVTNIATSKVIGESR